MAALSRRRLLGIGGAALTAGVGGWLAGARWLSPGEPGTLLRSQTPPPKPYRVALPIPPVLRPVRGDATTDHYEITQRIADLEIVPGLTTQAWTYNGMFPGPTLVARSGRRVVVRHRNELPEPTVVHLHGGHTPAGSDGYPMDVVLPADANDHEGHAGHSGHHAYRDVAHGFRDHTYPMAQRAATLWYHDHRHGATGRAVWHGLAGFHLVHDDEEDTLALPSGDRDIPLMITDRSFAADGSFHYPTSVHDSHNNGVLGDVILVNGAPWPTLETAPARYRLRLLNASNARRYRLALNPPPPGGGGIVQIGADGGLLARPVAHDAIDIAPAERFDVVVDFARYRPGTSVRLINRLGAGATTEVMRFDLTSSTGRDESRLPERLGTVAALNPAQAVATRTFHFQLRPDHGWTINGQPYRAGRTLARPRLDTIEIWRLISDFHHPVHIHLDPFQVLTRNNGAPGPYDQGWKDTVDLHPSEAIEIAVRFTDYAGTFMLHCHNFEHEDMAMMADFTTE